MFAIAEVNSDGEINLTELVGMMFPAAAEGLAKFRREYQPLMNAKQVLDFNLEWEGDTAKGSNAILAMGEIDQDGDQISLWTGLLKL